MAFEFIREMSGVSIAPNATVMGDVSIGKGSSVWYGSVIRGTEESITIGCRTNIQDNTVVHADENHPVTIGDNVTVGHSCIIHGCTIGSNTTIGMGAIVLSGARIGSNCFIGAGALVTGKSRIEDGKMVLGSPAKVTRSLTPEEIEDITATAELYVRDSEKHFTE